MKFDGVIFDLDGTLWDSTQSVAESWRATLSGRYNAAHLPSVEDVKGIMGLPFAEIARRLFAEFGEAREEVCRVCIGEENDYLRTHGARIYDGVARMLESLCKSRPLFIVSNCLPGYIESFLDVSGLGACFTAFECAGSTGLTKAGNIRLIAQRYGLKVPVYVGDTVMDEDSAAQAGCAFIHAGYGFGSARAPLAVINASGELPGLLSGLEALE